MDELTDLKINNATFYTVPFSLKRIKENLKNLELNEVSCRKKCIRKLKKLLPDTLITLNNVDENLTAKEFILMKFFPSFYKK